MQLIKLTLFAMFIFSASASLGDEYELVVLDAKEDQLDDYKKIEEIESRIKSHSLKVKSGERRAGYLPSLEEVDAVLYELDIDTRHMDRLDKDMFALSLRSWPLNRILKKFDGKVSEEEIRRAWNKLRKP